jgi:hypothetical protein
MCEHHLVSGTCTNITTCCAYPQGVSAVLTMNE